MSAIINSTLENKNCTTYDRWAGCSVKIAEWVERVGGKGKMMCT